MKPTPPGWFSGIDAGMFHALELAALVALVGLLFFVLNIYTEE